MSPAAGRRPVPPRILNQLATTLRALEGARRPGDGDREEARETALGDLDDLARLVEGVERGTLPDETPDRLDDARRVLSSNDLDGAREILIGVGRAIDEFLRG